jgi:hypothetical protein
VIRRVTLAIGAGTLIAAPSSAAAPATLPSPFVPLADVPPLRASTALTETRFPGRLSSSQLVRVTIDSTGRPFRVVDVDRIVIARKGDYSFVVAAPVEDVRRTAGSGSEPGLRAGAVVWQGFSPRRRVVAASITLRTRVAVPALPLRVEIDGSAVQLVNATSAAATTVDAIIPAASLAGALDAAKAALEAGAPTPAPVVEATGAVRGVRLLARVPLKVRGTIRYAGRPPRQVAAVLGAAPVRIDGSGDLKELELSVSVPEPASVLRPPGARHWLDLASSGRLPGGRRGTRLAVNRLLAAALALQYRQFLPNPDLNGSTRSSYRYELAERVRAPLAARSDDGSGWLVPLALALALAGALACALVLWAHS